jgi:hypothetical protein
VHKRRKLSLTAHLLPAQHTHHLFTHITPDTTSGHVDLQTQDYARALDGEGVGGELFIPKQEVLMVVDDLYIYMSIGILLGAWG